MRALHDHMTPADIANNEEVDLALREAEACFGLQVYLVLHYWLATAMTRIIHCRMKLQDLVLGHQLSQTWHRHNLSLCNPYKRN